MIGSKRPLPLNRVKVAGSNLQESDYPITTLSDLWLMPPASYVWEVMKIRESDDQQCYF